MRLSDQMVLGSTLKKHVNRVAVSATEGCALQLALTAIGEDDLMACFGTGIRFRWTKNTFACPHCSGHASAISIIACHLNDLHKWSLERIVSWVRSVEPKEKSQSQPQETLVNESICVPVSA